MELVPMTDTTTAADIFSPLIEHWTELKERVGVGRPHPVSLVTDGAPSMIREKK